VSAKEPARRLFIALWPTAEQQSRMAEATRGIVQASDARAVPISNLHVTLAFLGSVPERKLSELTGITQRVAGSAAAVPPLALSFERLEYWKKAQLLCAVPVPPNFEEGPDVCGDGGVRGASELAAAMKNNLVAGGFAPDLRPFRAHVTVARAARAAPPEARNSTMPSVLWTFSAFALVESHTERQGARYCVLESFALF
jgi:2'-5' RNA ligase